LDTLIYYNSWVRWDYF